VAEFAPIADEGFVVPTQVSYVRKSGLLYVEGEQIPGSAQVVVHFLRTGYLWDYVRRGRSVWWFLHVLSLLGFLFLS
jgi:hypothetical protein